jgi:hypothetical protein
VAQDDRRKKLRVDLVVPVRVTGFDSAESEWSEFTRSTDASLGGAGFDLQHSVDRGQCLHLTLPLPKRLRRYDQMASTYEVYALVRNVQGTVPPYRVGVLFFGKQPPKGFNENPTMRFLMPSDPPPARRERRQHRRLDVFMNLKIRRTNGEEEQTVAENLSKRGARIMTSLSVPAGETIEVEESDGSYRTRAVVRHAFTGADGIPRLNLYFTDETPDRLIGAE